MCGIPQDKLRDDLTTWLKEPGDPKTCLVTIPEGVVVVDEIHAAVEGAGMESVCIDMNGLHGVDLYSAARSPIAVTFRRKVIVVFDYDAIVSHNQPFLTHITSAMKLNIVPVVLVAQHMTGKTATLPVKGHHVITVPLPPPPPPPPEEEYEITIVYSKKDTFEDKGLLGAQHALCGRTDVDYRGDNIAYGGVFDSYLESCPNDAAHNIAEAYSWSDVVGDTMYGVAENDVYSFVPLMTTAAVFSSRPSTSKKVKSFGVVWSKNNARYAKVKNIQTIQSTMLDVQKRTLGLLNGMDFCRTWITTMCRQKEYARAAAFATQLGLTPQTLILLMRLWKTKYTLSIHAKVKQHM